MRTLIPSLVPTQSEDNITASVSDQGLADSKDKSQIHGGQAQQVETSSSTSGP